MIADAVHSLSDFITDAIVLIFVKIAGKPKDETHEYGHGKYETMATMVIGLILIIAGFGLMIDGVGHIIHSLRGREFATPGYDSSGGGCCVDNIKGMAISLYPPGGK